MTQQDIIAVFPLPNVVFFPGTDLPLHIFEPRYLEMVKDTVQNKQLIGMFLLQPGWENDYYGNPPLFPVGCAGELVDVQQAPEDRFNIVLRGLYRARALETVQELPYRKMRVEALPDIVPTDKKRVEKLKRELMQNFSTIAKHQKGDWTSLEKLTDFSDIVNSVSSQLEMDIEQKMKLLEENDVFQRAQTVSQILKRQISLLDWTNRFAHLRPTDPNLN
jgi:Lon protease-like protein